MIRLFRLLIHLDHLLAFIMVKESYVTRRLGRTNYTEHGDEIMCSMPKETSGDESSTHDSEAEDQGFLHRNSTVVGIIGTAYIFTVIIYLVMSRMWDQDEIKLHFLDAMVKICQALARTFGLWALEFENAYNEYVNILH